MSKVPGATFSVWQHGSPRAPDELGRPFLMWLRAATERAWSGVREPVLEEYEDRGVGGCDWRRGTRWSGGLSDAEIRNVESRFGIQFAPDHRLFLQLLHATEPPRRGAVLVGGDRVERVEAPGFYHWLRDEIAIRAASAEVIEGLLFDVEYNALWRDSWGARPRGPTGRRARVERLVAGAPRLLPIFGHRYVLAGGPTVVLSVHQSDIIVYGADLREYLLNELSELLGLDPELTVSPVGTDGIPFWGELIAWTARQGSPHSL
jgi:hypothetical protein